MVINFYGYIEETKGARTARKRRDAESKEIKGAKIKKLLRRRYTIQDSVPKAKSGAKAVGGRFASPPLSLSKS